MVELFEILFFSKAGIAGIVILAFMYGDWKKVNMGYKYSKYVTSSMFNPLKVINGNRWSTTAKIKNKLYKKADSFYIGNFRFSPFVRKHVRMPYLWKKKQENTKIYIDKKMMRQTTLVYGGMGSGKSQFFLNILEQIEQYDTAIVFDGGKNEFVSKLYNPLRDVIWNLYDDRATIHNFLDEDPALQAQFFSLLLKSKSGKQINFFATGAEEHIKSISLLTNAQNFTNTKDKWNYFIERLERLFVESLKDEQDSELDILSTLKQILTPIYLMNFRIQNGAKTFTIKNEIEKSHAAKLFISFPPQLKAELSSISSAFVALYTLVHLSLEDDEKRTNLYVIDELSSYLRMINDTEVIKDQLEKLRSKGGNYIGGLQGAEDREMNDILDKTINNKFYFRTDGRKTKDELIKSVGKISYEVWKKNNNKSLTQDEKERFLITEDDFYELGDRHEYIANIGDILYRGYTPQTNDEKEKLIRAEPFIEFKQRKEFEDYLAFKYEDLQNRKYGKNKESAAAEDVAETNQDELNF